MEPGQRGFPGIFIDLALLQQDVQDFTTAVLLWSITAESSTLYPDKEH